MIPVTLIVAMRDAIDVFERTPNFPLEFVIPKGSHGDELIIKCHVSNEK
jgi:hypothetical protein